jgi:hypothetical protein
MVPPRLVQELLHLNATGEDVGVDRRRRPRDEHGDDHRDKWESPMGHRLATTLAKRSGFLNP